MRPAPIDRWAIGCGHGTCMARAAASRPPAAITRRRATAPRIDDVPRRRTGEIPLTIQLSAFRWVPPVAQGYVRDLRVRWALEEAGLTYEAALVNSQILASPGY